VHSTGRRLRVTWANPPTEPGEAREERPVPRKEDVKTPPRHTVRRDNEGVPRERTIDQPLNNRIVGIALLSALLAPPAAAAALIPARSHTDNANIALALVVVVVAVATFGHRLATVVSAISAAGWFDFFHTRPYYSFTISAHDDVVTAVLLLVVGVVVGELAIRTRRHLLEARTGSGDISNLHAIAELVAAGEKPDIAVVTVASELRRLFGLRDCTFERAPFESNPRVARFERSGNVVVGELSWGVGTMGLPGKQVELVVSGFGRTFGRFLMTPTPGHPVSFDRRIIAIALADQVAAAFIAESATSNS
jgi:K+-sensing histidine kinase KdpD